MEGTTLNGTRLATYDELSDADALRSIISTGLAVQPIDDRSVRRGVWAYVCGARDLGTPPGDVIRALTTVVEAASITPRSVRDATLRRVILWCVDAYFGHVGELTEVAEPVSVSVEPPQPLPPVRASNR